MKLSQEAYLQLIENGPLVCIDLVLQDPAGRTLLGFRNNEPAKDFWFAPGGCIRKDESLTDALARLVDAELGNALPPAKFSFHSVHEHFYSNNFAGSDSISTHCVVLAYHAQLAEPASFVGDDQHSALKWWPTSEALASPQVHPHTKAYFKVHH